MDAFFPPYILRRFHIESVTRAIKWKNPGFIALNSKRHSVLNEIRTKNANDKRQKKHFSF